MVCDGNFFLAFNPPPRAEGVVPGAWQACLPGRANSSSLLWSRLTWSCSSRPHRWGGTDAWSRCSADSTASAGVVPAAVGGRGGPGGGRGASSATVWAMRIRRRLLLLLLLS